MSTSAAPVLAVNARDPEETRLALAVEGRLVDLRWTRTERGSLVGGIFLGVVTRVEEGLDAAFVDLGLGRAGFLHVGQVHPAYADSSLDAAAIALLPAPREAGARSLIGSGGLESEAPDPPPDEPAARAPRIGDWLKPGRRVVVQVLRDPVRQKGATLSTFLSLAGHRLVYMPSLGRPGASRRLSDPAERERLRRGLEEISGPGVGLIARTAAEGCDLEVLRSEWAGLQKRWQEVEGRARHAHAPISLLSEESPVVRAARELLTPDLGRIVVDDAETAAALAEGLREAGISAPVIERYDNSRPLFEALDLERDWQGLFRPRVPLPSGASIVIHETEALTAIDVNSGPTDLDTLEETALASNLGAVDEIARQVRLRDLGGILVVDFIDMKRAEHRRQVEAALRNALLRDRARLKTSHLGSFGLMAFTRRRVGGGIPRAVETLCRGCGGSGHVAHHQAGALRALRRMRAEPEARSFRVRAQPGTCAILRSGLQDSVAGLGRPVEILEDVQVAAADPVVLPELLAGGGGGG
jgi:Rne/Rng family ribonuclease